MLFKQDTYRASFSFKDISLLRVPLRENSEKILSRAVCSIMVTTTLHTVDVEMPTPFHRDALVARTLTDQLNKWS